MQFPVKHVEAVIRGEILAIQRSTIIHFAYINTLHITMMYVGFIVHLRMYVHIGLMK